jgi:RNA polymerase sigma-70 factor (ECF subfamily)
MATTAAPEPSADRLRRVLTEHGPALRRFATSWTRSDAERDDLLQDIAIALLAALPRFRGDCPERAFVWRVAHNRACTATSQRKRTEAFDGTVDVESRASTSPSPHDVVEHRQRLDRLQRALRLLRADQRLLVMLALEGLSLDETAAVVGGTANAVGVRLHRARAALLAAVASLDVPQETP